MAEDYLDGLDFNLDLGQLGIGNDEPEEEKKQEEEKPERHVEIKHRRGHRHLSRKVTSENALMNFMRWHYERGDCFHCFSFGDVDSLSYFKHILRQQPVYYLAISTWCMAGEDVKDLRDWHRRGMLGRVDLFVGEIFQGSYPEVYNDAVEFAKECGGRLVVFRNHAKVMAVIGERFDALIESSANVNTNPRSENTVVTVDSSLVADYVELFNGIIPFNKDFKDPGGYEIPECMKKRIQEERNGDG